ncbi:VOC family protein [Undibacterium sp. TS12]|uniref:VOC family protein n=1 Tax=Undibacterium sp. TS12 TaxID=2908202 RepID=UPI001F4CBE5D|nr:VOC family protein [Undibacterium sp. TS12]MCH8617942.1 VOC family protein [Undibacterium sp. TS12]
MQKITPFLWFDHQAEEAVEFYTSIFKDTKVHSVSRYGEGAPLPKGTVLTIKFTLAGQEFVALNGGPHYSFTPAISFVVDCESQEEVDYYWEKLLAGGGEENQCAWLRDKYGVSWQVVPRALINYLNDTDAAKAQRVMMAMFQMKKIIIADLDKAYAGA